MRPRTVRAKLILTTTLVMAFVLAALGLLVDFGTNRTVRGNVDADLQRRARDFARGESRRRRDRPPIPFGGPRNGPGDRGPHRPRLAEADESRPRFVRSAGVEGPQETPYDSAAANATEKGGFRWTTVENEKGRYRVYSEALGREGVVQTQSPLADVEASLAGLRRLLLTVVLPLGTLLAGLASLFIVDRMLRPLRLINENAQTIGGDNPEGRLPVVGDDEFAGLATTLNGMLARLEEGFRLEQATTRRLAATVEQQRRFTADASHELKTPLSTIKAFVGLLHPRTEDDRESVGAIRDAADRMRGLVDDLLTLARADGGSLVSKAAPVDLATIVGAAVMAVSPYPVEVRGTATPLVVSGNGEALTRLFINLLDNARKYAGGPVAVHLAKRGDTAEVAVIDRGVGIAPEHLPRLFDRFYRPDESRTSETGGTGLGLAICREIAGAHGGSIEVTSRVGEGTTFIVVLPLASRGRASSFVRILGL